MIQRILVALDTLSEQHPAFVEAQRQFPDAELHLLHIAAPGAAPSAKTYAQGEEARRQMAQLGLGEVLDTGQPAAEILARAQSGKFDLVVMGTAVQKSRIRFSMGSVAQRVVRESPVPVITVRMSASAPVTPTQPVERVLVLHDFSASADNARRFVTEHLPQAQVSLIHVVSAQHTEEQRTEARTRLAQLGSGRVVQGDPADMAMMQAESGRFDLLAVGTSSKGRLDQFLFGSVAQKLVSESPVAVLTVRGEN